MSIFLAVLVGWFVLSVPAALFLGFVLRRLSHDEPQVAQVDAKDEKVIELYHAS